MSLLNGLHPKSNSLAVSRTHRSAPTADAAPSCDKSIPSSSPMKDSAPRLQQSENLSDWTDTVVAGVEVPAEGPVQFFRFTPADD